MLTNVCYYPYMIPVARKTMEAANGIYYAACSLEGFMMGLNDYSL